MDIDAEREKITKEIKELERILDPSFSSINVEVSESSLDSDSDADSLPDEDSDAAGPAISEEDRGGEASNDEDDPKEKALPEDPETCLQLNMVYQEVIQEKLAEVSLLLAQNREQQEEVTWHLAGSKGPEGKDGKSLPSNLYIGHFMKPYFKDRLTGVGPPANEDTREKAAQGIKSFEELLVTKWKSWEKALLRKSVVSDRLQRLLQPKLLKLEYLQQKQSRVTSEAERQVLEMQSREAESEIQAINQLPEEALLGSRLDSHDWEKISNVNFEGGRSAKEIRKFWQNSEHPSINKQEWSGQEVDQLKAIAAKHGHLEWQKIAEELGTSRSAFQCLQRYQQHNTALKRREWTEQEDRMLTQLVQEMRVGSHIPYRKIVYYMEGRDSMQLIYRWTKSLDPSLKKGFWAPEEDAKLLQAVAKYGEQDWFKIREEVPGRSDAQCRDRYLRRLHFSLKKGRWNSKEEEKLMELIEKYGVGHWAKIASELPHRTGSQCLSKWKVMVRKKQSRGRRRRRPLRSVRWSSSSGDSSSGGSSSGDSSSGGSSSSESSEDSEPEPGEAQESSQALLSAQHTVPDMDLWVPARQSTSAPWGRAAGSWPGRSAASPSPPKGSDMAQGGGREACTTEEAGQAQAPSGTHSASLTGIEYPCSADTHPKSSEGPADEGGKRLLKVPLETVLRVLRTNTATRCRTLKKLRQPRLLGAPLEASPGGSGVARPRLRQLWHDSVGSRQRRRGHALQRRLLERQLLMAVSAWVGDIVLPCTSRRPAVVHTRADSVREQLQEAHLASTPVFTLFLQLFQIDTAGCMEVVRERKAQPPALLQAGAWDPLVRLLQMPSSAQNTPGCLFQNVPAREPAKRSTSHRGRGGLQACRTESTPQAPPPAPCGPRPKPKTVSELLREKRLREARARTAAQGPVVVPPPLLGSSPVTLKLPLPLAPKGLTASGPIISNVAPCGPGAPAAASPSTSGSWASAKVERPPTLQALGLAVKALATPAASATSGAPALGSAQVPGGCPLSSLGQSQAPATSRRQGLPEALPFLPAAPSPAQLPVQPLSLMPALGTCRGGPQVSVSSPLPVTWVLTAQGLLPVPVPTVVSLPRPAGIPGPKGLSVTPLPSLTETQAGQGPRLPGLSHPWQPPANVDTELDPPAKTGFSTLPTPPPSQSPAEVDSDTARAPGGLSSPEEAQVAGETAAPRTSSQATLLADHPEAEPPQSSQLPPQSGPGPGGTLGSPSEPGEPRGPLALERLPAPRPGPEKGALDLGLLSQESEAAVREWLRGQRGVCVPALGSRLPYQPPALCSLRALSGLLLHKEALEHRAASLVPGGAAGALQTSLGRVRRQFQDNPAYLLLRARFLAAFALPALLATLPPHGVPTTLSATTRADSASEDDSLGELEFTDGGRRRGCSVSSPQAEPAATAPIQGTAELGGGSVPSFLDSSDDLDVLRTRHTRHVRKRRRLV
ncbi:snRNA-activating protein complex subunit 4 isoform X2 [Diceros bicornis minor]|uniref:snRNA-activating protein complex subunit 4 isoform X2 n=1 Tax=Diceros bicornis minor TaxID=77932 RepID=UPI0026F31011|nr:snRNA-activating protein complex subunit 4 isoform X2 [Diceros bicornis minor]XP_058380458.1 snRNA-activating protein complex subunit 4 isoform X2 [Diceros bicornis minor]XP_058380459.1 snRNA-activating protein complex subunit 4 isoform X2 [Diceros bicornis minor]